MSMCVVRLLPGLLVASVAFVVRAAPVTAQTTSVEASARFQAMHDRALQAHFPIGWSADVAVNGAGSWSFLAEVGRAYRSNDVLDTDLDVLTLGGGARWSFWREASVTPFGQLVVGWARMTSQARFAEESISASQNKLMLEPGAGVRVPIGSRWGAVGQVSFRRIFLDEERDGSSGINEITVSAGVRVGF